MPPEAPAGCGMADLSVLAERDSDAAVAFVLVVYR
jgi:hypothetical protein